jgi:hypothetical protein
MANSLTGQQRTQDTTFLSIRLPTSLHHTLKLQALKRNSTMGALVTAAVRQYLKDE